MIHQLTHTEPLVDAPFISRIMIPSPVTKQPAKFGIIQDGSLIIS